MNFYFNVRFEAEAGERPRKGIFYPFCFVGQSWTLNLNLSLNLNLAYLTGKQDSQVKPHVILLFAGRSLGGGIYIHINTIRKVSGGIPQNNKSTKCPYYGIISVCLHPN